MAVEFPSRLSFVFGSTEKIFKTYVHDVCAERGYSNREPWTVTTAYGFGNSLTGGLDAHVGQIYEKMKDDLSGYGATRRWANRAAEAICPQRGGGGGSPPPASGSSEIRRRGRTMMSMLQADQLQEQLHARTREQQVGALMMFDLLASRNGTCGMMWMPAWRMFALPMAVMIR